MMKIKGNECNLLEVVNGPVESHLPRDCAFVGTSAKGKLVPDLDEFVENRLKEYRHIAIAIGCSSQGSHGMDAPYTTECISISHYALSTQCVCQKVCFAGEEVLNVLGI